MSTDTTDREAVLGQLHRINDCWLEGRPEDLAPLLHEQVVMILPTFSGRATGREALIAGFRDFCRQATMHRFDQTEIEIDVAGDTAVASFAFVMIYERDNAKRQSTGRDLWVFTRLAGQWLVTWRTMLDLKDVVVDA